MRARFYRDYGKRGFGAVPRGRVVLGSKGPSHGKGDLCRLIDWYLQRRKAHVMGVGLERFSSFPGRKGPLLLVIMDGIGIGRKDESNTVYMARAPCLDRLLTDPLYVELKAHGRAVGLPSDDDMGNSEVGHNAIGAGRIFDQGALLVSKAIESGRLFETRIWKTLVDRGRSGGTLHFLELLSDGNVHSHVGHLYRMIDACETQGVPRVRAHVLLDGPDVGSDLPLTTSFPWRQDYPRSPAPGRWIMPWPRAVAE